jgi:hypothetical protein
MSIEKLELLDLKKTPSEKNSNVKENYAKINSNIKQIEQNQKNKSIINIPKTVIDRYNKQFRHDKTKNALKNTIIAFGLIFCVLLFFQPGLMPLIDKPGIINLTSHTIDDIFISNLMNQDELTIQTSLQSQSSKEFKLEGGIYLVTAKRQFPIILVVQTALPEKIPNALEQKIDEYNRGLQ